jgi:hypothetical protein
MAQIQTHLVVAGTGWPHGFELRIGDRRVPFDFDEAERLADQGFSVVTGDGPTAGQTLAIHLGGQWLTLTDDEARQLADIPPKIQDLLAAADRLRQHHQAASPAPATPSPSPPPSRPAWLARLIPGRDGTARR